MRKNNLKLLHVELREVMKCVVDVFVLHVERHVSTLMFPIIIEKRTLAWNIKPCSYFTFFWITISYEEIQFFGQVLSTASE